MILQEKTNKLEPKYEKSQTLSFSYIGSYSRSFALNGIKQTNEDLFKSYEDYLVFQYDIPRECAKSMIHSYGTMALRVAQYGYENTTKAKKMNERVHPDYPYLRSELAYAIKHEMVEKPNDVLCRRVPIAFLNKQLTIALLPEVVDMMAKERRWSNSKKKEELDEAIKMMEFMK